MLTVNKNSIIYIVCPANFATGGPEELHEIGKELIDIGYEVYMHYYHFDNINISPVHKEYLHFSVPHTDKILNSENNIIIFPETFCTFLFEKKYSNLQKIVWWLSVTNFTISLNTIRESYKKKSFYFIKKYYKNYPIPTLSKIKELNVHHIAHSYFSLDFLNQNDIPIIGQISGYMDKMFYENVNLKPNKENIVIYNALKNGDFLEKIRLQTPEIEWVGIQNMTLQEVANWMKKAKVYVDFGYHPGKEKMPRQSCLLDCCIIIGKQGSAKYKEDMPILDDYHFEDIDENIPNIIFKIKDCLLNYNERVKDFKKYKDFLLNEKQYFTESVQNVFKKKINEI
jgi:hypothetical protein